MLRLSASIGRRVASKPNVLRPTRQTRQVVASVVYRYDDTATRDWEEAMGAGTLKMLSDVPEERRGVVSRLQRDYWARVLSEDVVFSLPAGAEENGGQDRLFFTIVHMRVFEQKKMCTGRRREVERQQTYTASVQRMRVWCPGDGAVQDGQQLLVHEGDPEVVDLLDWAEWPAWSSHLTRWTSTQSPLEGCSAVRDGQLVVVTADWQDDSVPTWVVLKALQDAGWTRGVAPSEHTLASEKRFRAVQDVLGQKSYMRCLLGLSQLLRGSFAKLHPAQPAKYYDLVLCVEEPHTVSVGLTASQYEEVLKAVARGERHALLQPAGGAAGADAPICDAEDAQELLHIEPPMWPVLRPELKRPARRDVNDVVLDEGEEQCKRRRLEQLVDEDWAALLWDELQADAGEVASGEGAGDAAAAVVSGESTAAVAMEEVQSSAGAACSWEPAPAPPANVAADVPVIEAPASGARAARASGPGRMLEGAWITVEDRGTRSSYCRARVTCPVHADCGTSRSFSRRRGAWQDEPYCFLGVWLARANWYIDGESHKEARSEVTREDTVEYGQALGMHPGDT